MIQRIIKIGLAGILTAGLLLTCDIKKTQSKENENKQINQIIKEAKK